ncbi:hypothetical protein JCM16138_02460 [Thermococcus atlanticus]
MKKTKRSRKEEIIKLLKEGKSVSEIAAELKVSKSYVSRVKGELMAVTIRNKGELEAKAFELFEKGMSPVKVVMTLRVPAETVKEIYREYLALKDLPPLTAWDLEEEFMNLEDTMENLKEKIEQKEQLIRSALSTSLEKTIRSMHKEVKELFDTWSSQMEKEYNALLGLSIEIYCLVGLLLLDRLAEYAMTTPKKSLIMATEEYNATMRWIELASKINEAYKDIQHPAKEVLELIRKKAETFGDILKNSGYIDVAEVFYNMAKALSG